MRAAVAPPAGVACLLAGALILTAGVGERSAAAAPAGHPAAGDTVVVTMTNALVYEPAELRIRAGQTVLWRNTSQIAHTVTADPERAAAEESVRLPNGAEPFDSGDMAPGAEFSRTFTVAGAYTYFCVPHELAGMVGTLTVEP